MSRQLPPPDYAQPVYRNFKETVPVGASSFRVSVPRSYTSVRLPNGQTLHRHFRFSELNVTPGFFSQRAMVIGVDGDGTVEPAETDLALRFALGFTCPESLYFSERANGLLVESPFDQLNREMTLQEFVSGLNAHFAALTPVGFRRPPVFFDWVDLSWYRTQGQPDEPQQVAHDSADQVRAGHDVGELALSELYYGVEEEDLGPFFDALPASARRLTGVNNYLLPTTLETEDSAELLNNVRIRIHIAPNVAASFSSETQLRVLGFTAEQVGGRGLKKRFHLKNRALQGSDYIVLTGLLPPLVILRATSGRVFCKPAKNVHVFDWETVTFPAGAFSENTRVHAVVRAAMDPALESAGLRFPQLRYDGVTGKFRFEHPPNDRLFLFLECDDRLSERLGFGPVGRITRYLLNSVVRDGTSTLDAESLSKALAFDAGMCLVTLDEASGNDTYGVGEFVMTTLWPTASGTFSMSDKFSRPAYLPTVSGAGKRQDLIEVAFTVSTLKSESTRIPLCWPISFCVEGTLEGTTV